MPSVAPWVVKKPPYTASRKLPPHARSAVAKHARQVGEINLAWNSLQASFFLLFRRIVSPDNGDLALGIWHTVQSDKAQRTMLANAIQHGLRKQKSIQSAGLWAIAAADKISDTRNFLTHAEVYVDYDGLNFDPTAARRSSFDRLWQIPTSQVWRKVRGDLYALEDYVGHLAWDASTNGPARRPSMKRPRLLSVQVTKKRTRPKPRLRSKAKRPRPPEPSAG